MGPRSLTNFTAVPLLAALVGASACRTVPNPPVAPPQEAQPASPPAPPPPAKPATMAERVVADFEAAVRTSRDAYVALFDFVAVGEMEILLHRYDLLGRLELPDDVKAQFAGEGAVPYPAEREKKNVSGFYKILGQRTVGSGGCVAGEPRTEYGKALGAYEPLPEGALVDYGPLRQKAVTYLEKGGVVGLRCKGGKGGVALVWTERPNARGYDLITIYDD